MAERKTALITGITGQDGAYLAQFLLQKDYHVVGAARRASTLNLPRLAELGISASVDLRMLDIQDLTGIIRLIDETRPHEIYHLGGQSSVPASFQQPIYTAETTTLGILRLLEAIKLTAPETRLFYASSSEIFGRGMAGGLIDETGACRPRSPYGAAKLMAYWSVKNYRQAYGLNASSGILFNHESPMRGMDFVTRKITASLAQMACGNQQVLSLGNLDNARDWGYAADYVEAMWLMLQHEKADDFVIASGEIHSVREFVDAAAEVMGFDMVWEGAGIETKGFDRKTGRQLVAVDAAFFRPSEPDTLLGNAAKAQRVLGWRPRTGFQQLVEIMAEADLARARNGKVWF